MGAHTLGGANRNNSGYAGTWTPSGARVFNNRYIFKNHFCPYNALNYFIAHRLYSFMLEDKSVVLWNNTVSFYRHYRVSS